MKKLLLVMLVALMATSLFAAGGTEAGSAKAATLTIMQNKPEIGPQLEAYAAQWGTANNVKVTVKSIGGTAGAMGPQLKADYAAGDMPDIFTFDGLESYKEWEGVVLDVSSEPWVSKTAVAFKYNGKVFGAPVAVEGWGMAYKIGRAHV